MPYRPKRNSKKGGDDTAPGTPHVVHRMTTQQKQRKNTREKQRRLLLSDQFEELCALTGMDSKRTERCQVLSTTIELLRMLQHENAALKGERIRLQTEVSKLCDCLQTLAPRNSTQPMPPTQMMPQHGQPGAMNVPTQMTQAGLVAPNGQGFPVNAAYLAQKQAPTQQPHGPPVVHRMGSVDSTVSAMDTSAVVKEEDENSDSEGEEHSGDPVKPDLLSGTMGDLVRAQLDWNAQQQQFMSQQSLMLPQQALQSPVQPMQPMQQPQYPMQPMQPMQPIQPQQPQWPQPMAAAPHLQQNPHAHFPSTEEPPPSYEASQQMQFQFQQHQPAFQAQAQSHGYSAPQPQYPRQRSGSGATLPRPAGLADPGAGLALDPMFDFTEPQGEPDSPLLFTSTPAALWPSMTDTSANNSPR